MTTQNISLAAEVLGITDPSNVGRSLNEAHTVLTGEPYNPAYYITTALKHPHQRTDTEEERLADFRSVGEIIIDQSIKTATSLTDWPVYTAMMQRDGKRANGTASALMIGSLSSLSSRSFVCLARTEYGANNAHIVDPVAGADKVGHGKFAYGSGLALPYRSDSMDYVHTNQLIHMLEDPSSPSRPLRQKMLLLFSEIARVLAPGGQLLMKEMPPSAKDKTLNIYERQKEADELCAFVAKALHRFGLSNVRAEPAPAYECLPTLLDAKRNFDDHFLGINVSAIAVYARKRARAKHARPMRGPIAL